MSEYITVCVCVSLVILLRSGAARRPFKWSLSILYTRKKNYKSFACALRFVVVMTVCVVVAVVVCIKFHKCSI